MRIHIRHILSKRVAAIVGILVLTSSLVGSVVYAAYDGRFPSDYWGITDQGLFLVTGATTDVPNASAYFKVYFDSHNGGETIQILNKNLCSSQGSGIDNGGGAIASGATVSMYRIHGTAGDWDYAGVKSCDMTYLTINIYSQLVADTLVPGRWFIMIEAWPTSSGYMNDYQIYGNNNAYYGLMTNQMVAIESRLRYDSTYWGGVWGFGADCTVVAPQTAYIGIYDMDNQVAGIQPDPMVGVVIDDTTGAWNYLTLPAGQGSNWTNIPFTITPGHRYRLDLDHIYWNNTIQVRLPYDSAYWAAPCSPTISTDYGVKLVNPTTGLEYTDSIAAGEPVRATAHIYNNGSVNYSYYFSRLMWWDLAGGTPNGADASEFPPIRLDQPIQVGGHWPGLDLTAAGYPGTIPNYDNFIGGITPPANATQLCTAIATYSDSYTLWPSGTAVPAGTVGGWWAVKCVPIAKYPALNVTGGDVRVGGSFPGTSASVCTLPKNAVDGNNPYGILMHNYATGTRGDKGELAITSPGLIRSMGSGNIYSPSVGDTLLNFGSGSFSGTYNANDNGYFLGSNIPSLTTSMQSYCLPDTQQLYPAIGSTINVAGGTQYDMWDINNYYATPSAYFRSATVNFTGSNGILSIGDYNSSPTTLRAWDYMRPSQTVIIHVKRTGNGTGNKVVFNNRVLYPNGVYNSISELPHFVLVVDDPAIAVSVEGGSNNPNMIVYGIISTPGNVNTCSTLNGDPSDGYVYTSATCGGTPFYMRGALIAGGRVVPMRTYGYDSTTDSTNYAENFNLSPAVLLADYSRASRQPVLTTDYQTELPTRY